MLYHSGKSGPAVSSECENVGNEKWLQSEVLRLKEPAGFRLRAWNRLPPARLAYDGRPSP
jgi:hypothetical protein